MMNIPTPTSSVFTNTDADTSRYRYDGLYVVEEVCFFHSSQLLRSPLINAQLYRHGSIKAKSGFTVCKFRLRVSDSIF
jgi:hypothetical protein